MTREDSLRGLLGLAARARQITLGEEMTVKAIRAGKAAIAFLDADASENARKRLSDTCTHYGVPLYELPAGLLGAACGKQGRMSAALPHGGFSAKALREMSAQHTSQQDET